MTSPSSCDPCGCIPPNMSDAYFKQAVLEIACQILVAIEEGGGGGGGGGGECACPQFIQKDGSTVTTATIPFAIGLSLGDGIVNGITVGSAGSKIYNSDIPGDNSFVMAAAPGHRIFYEALGGATYVEYGMPVFYSDNIATWGLSGTDGQIFWDDSTIPPQFVIRTLDPVPANILLDPQVSLLVDNHTYPVVDATYDLGEPARRWKDLYLSGAFSATAISADDVSSIGNTLNLNGTVDIRFNIAGGLEAIITANTFTFNAGANDVSLDWSVNNQLGITAGNVLISSAIEIDGALNHDGTTAGLFGVTPVTRPVATADIKDALTSLGILQGTSSSPLNLDGGQLTAGNISSSALNVGQFVWYNAGVLATDADASFDGVNAIFTRLQGRIGYQTGGAAARVPMVLIRSNTQVGNSAGGADSTLWSETIAADTLEFDGDYIKYEATGTFAATANNKRIKIKLGATTVYDSGALAITAAGDWHLQGVIYRTAANTQKNWGTLTASNLGTLTPPVDYTTSAEADNVSQTFALTGAGTSASDVVFECGIGMYGPQSA